MTYSESVFYDTSAWIALYDQDDEEHEKASRWHRRISSEKRFIVTTNLVFAETHAYFSRSPKAFQIGETIRSSRVVRYQMVTLEDEEKAWQILKKYKDKDFSFCDATSFAIIERCEIPYALSFDKHFSQYGIALYGGFEDDLFNNP